MASASRLRYWSDDRPAIRRLRAGDGFRYLHPDGRPLRDRAALKRIRALAIPPAWTDVRIAPQPSAHLQATGRDARGRKQYRYHAAYRARRDAAKFDQLLEFGRRLPRIRRRVARDLRRRGLPRDKVLAGVVRLLELTLIRVGNEEYVRLNGSFGLTTLRDRHVTVRGETVRLRFRAKGGHMRDARFGDRALARLVARCQDLPGQALFQYLDEGGHRVSVGSADVNAYLRDASGADVTAKMFRTWTATVLACRALGLTTASGAARGSQDDDHPASTVARRQVVAAMKAVADRLGNTPAVTRSSYVHPGVVDAFLANGRAAPTIDLGPIRSPTRAEEAAVVRLLSRPPAVATRRTRPRS
jgi:DNA topoisomerase-1